MGSAEEKLQYREANAVSLPAMSMLSSARLFRSVQRMTRLTLLLATDLVARGIDIDSLECVVNYDLPRDLETYTHRSGRTGRMGKEGNRLLLHQPPRRIKNTSKI